MEEVKHEEVLLKEDKHAYLKAVKKLRQEKDLINDDVLSLK